MKAILVIGSNLGEREENLNRAVELLSERMKPLSLSGIMETEAIGFDGCDFLNQAAAFETDMGPFELLEFCKETERKMGRTDVPEYTEEGKRIYHNRVIDIDILKFGDLIMKTPALTLPHPQLETRPYVRTLIKQLQTILKT